nr:hypothetical protein [Tanacetum cinerariifolium]
MLGAAKVQIPKNNLDNLHSSIEEDETLEAVDPQDLVGFFLLADTDLITLDLLIGLVVLDFLGCYSLALVDGFTPLEDNIGLPELKFKKEHLCSACAMGKRKKKPHKPKSKDTKQEKLYLLHMDLCGPMRVVSVNRKKTNNGTEFVNQTLREYYEKVGISYETFVARSPQQNGVIEGCNRTLIEAACTMNVRISRVYYVEGIGHNLFSIGQLCDSNLEVTFRQHTCYIRNLKGQMSFFLGLQISQSLRGIFINQSRYASEIVKKYGMHDSVNTPMVEKSKLDEDLQGKPAKPTEKYLQAVKWIFRYLKGTIYMELWYSKDTDMSLTAYADADHAGCHDTRRSTSGSA